MTRNNCSVPPAVSPLFNFWSACPAYVISNNSTARAFDFDLGCVSINSFKYASRLSSGWVNTSSTYSDSLASSSAISAVVFFLTGVIFVVALALRLGFGASVFGDSFGDSVFGNSFNTGSVFGDSEATGSATGVSVGFGSSLGGVASGCGFWASLTVRGRVFWVFVALAKIVCGASAEVSGLPTATVDGSRSATLKAIFSATAFTKMCMPLSTASLIRPSAKGACMR